MEIKITSIEELAQIWLEVFRNITGKATKIAEDSILKGIANACSKIGQKAMKDVALIESHLFIDSAFGSHLDVIASDNGIAPRFTALGSSTYVRIVGDVGTSYDETVNFFKSIDGQTFILEGSFVIPSQGYVYAKVLSESTGVKTNVAGLTINTIDPTPTGHNYCINEYKAEGGLDTEDDKTFRTRIKEGGNILARNTLSMLEQVFMKINPIVLRLRYQGIDTLGNVKLAVVTKNGVDLTSTQLNELLLGSKDYFTLSDTMPYDIEDYGMSLNNIEWQTINIDFRCKLDSAYNPDDVRKEIQLKISKYMDYRYWDYDDKVEWDDLLQIVKLTSGVLYVSDKYFTPSSDITVNKDKLPRVYSFLMRDLDGNILTNINNTLDPVYFPSKVNDSINDTIL